MLYVCAALYVDVVILVCISVFTFENIESYVLILCRNMIIYLAFLCWFSIKILAQSYYKKINRYILEKFNFYLLTTLFIWGKNTEKLFFLTKSLNLVFGSHGRFLKKYYALTLDFLRNDNYCLLENRRYIIRKLGWILFILGKIYILTKNINKISKFG